MVSTTGSGGGFYLNGPHVSLSLSGISTAARLQLGTSSSTLVSGGLIYANSALTLSLSHVALSTITAKVSGGMLYAVNMQQITLSDVTANTLQATTGSGGLIYIGSGATSLTSLSLTNVAAA